MVAGQDGAASMDTPAIEQIYRHASVRQYKPDSVSPQAVEAIVAAGQRSSTSSNLQTYSVVAITDEEKKAQIAELSGGQRQILQAPVFLAWCADLSRLDRVCEMRGYQQVTSHVESLIVAVVDAAIAMQTAALAAESLGLGMCYIGGIRNQPQKVIALLQLPKLVFPISGMTLGWPAVEPSVRPRLPLEAVLHWESYDSSQEIQALEAYDRAMIETGIYRGRQVPMPDSDGEEEDYGWLEHSARRASTPVRTCLRQVLRQQGLELA
jgi:FMN reductase (NADPH)